jgi:hypothetical protein
LFEHDLFGKPVPTFPDHALVSGPVVSWGPARNEAEENPVRGADFERGKFSGEGPSR